MTLQYCVGDFCDKEDKRYTRSRVMSVLVKRTYRENQ